MNRCVRFILAGMIVSMVSTNAGAQAAPVERKPFHDLAPTPPMGWNSWDCFGTAVTEEQTKANADYMAEKLARFGYEYVVVDIQWYEPQAGGHDYRAGAPLIMDDYGRLMPAENRFPSAAGGKGFKPLADYIHGKGLKFGIHLLRGVPRQAVERNLPILGSTARAADIADKNAPCPWNPDMWGVDMSKPGAQAYYDSVFKLFAEWDVDFVKVDDLMRPYYVKEVEAIRSAMDRCGRPIVLSTSPGETPLDAGPHIAAHANMWRISDDFWDDWKALLAQFERCRKWAEFTGPGHYPDADMLPVGAVRMHRDGWARLSHDEQYTLMSLWAICRSPLMIGGHLPRNDEFTLALLTNAEVLAVNQRSSGGRELYRRDGLIAWVADAPEAGAKYVAMFNTRDRPRDSAEAGVEVAVDLRELGFEGAATVRDFWAGTENVVSDGRYAPQVNWHGSRLVRVSGR